MEPDLDCQEGKTVSLVEYFPDMDVTNLLVKVNSESFATS